MKCGQCGQINKSYVIHYDKNSCEPVRIDLWLHYKSRSRFIDSVTLMKNDSKLYLNPLFYCGDCCSAIIDRFYSKEDYFMSITSSRGKNR